MIRKKRPTILYVDVDQNNRRLFRSRYKYDFCLFTAMNEFEANVALSKNSIDIVVCDHMLEQITGLDFLNMVRIKWPAIITVLLTKFSDDRVLSTVVRTMGIHYCFKQPYNHYALEDLFKEAS